MLNTIRPKKDLVITIRNVKLVRRVKFSLRRVRYTGLAEWLRRWTQDPMDSCPRGFEPHTQYAFNHDYY